MEVTDLKKFMIESVKKGNILENYQNQIKGLLFADFEANGIFDAKKHICKQTYRNLCRSIFIKKTRKKALQNLVKGYCELRNDTAKKIISKYYPVTKIAVEGNDAYLEKIQQQMFKDSNDIQKEKEFKNKLWQEINGMETGLRFLIYELDYVIPVATCAVTGISINENNHIVAIDIIPLSNQTILSISYMDEMPFALEEYLNKHINYSIDFVNLVESIMIYGTDQWFLKPNIWNNITDKRKKAILRKMMVIDVPFFQETKYSLFDDLRKYLIRGMIKNNVDKKIIEKEMAKLVYHKCTDYLYLTDKIEGLIS